MISGREIGHEEREDVAADILAGRVPATFTKSSRTLDSGQALLKASGRAAG